MRIRVVLIVALPAALLVAGHGVLRLWQEQEQLRAEESRTVALIGRAVGIAVENALRDRQVADVRRLLVEIVERQEGIDRVRLFDRQLKLTLVSNALTIGDAVSSEALREVMASGAPRGLYQRVAGHSIYYYLVPLRGRGDQIGGAMEIVRLASGIDRRYRAASMDILVRLGLLLLAVVVLVTFVMQRQVVRPVAALVAGLQRLGRGQTEPLLPVTRRDELGRAAEAFNETARRLEAARAQLLAETERALELEREVQRAVALAIAGKLATALAHEVGTPLNVIAGRAEVALKALPAEMPVREDLEVIAGQIDRITKIINSLLDIVRPQAPVARRCELAAVLEPLIPLFRHAARARGISFTSAVAADAPSIVADPGQLQQVMTNVVMNALEATPGGGDVSLTVAASNGARRGVTIAVTDTGSGIPPEALPRVFDSFFTTKPRGQGTGLGLAISRDIVRAHGGDITIESEPGRRTVVTIWLPEAYAELGPRLDVAEPSGG